MAFYPYVIETIFIISTALFTLKKYSAASDKKRKKEILFIGLGATVFLLSFTGGNLIGSFTTQWQVAQFGLFGAVFFVSFLAYSIVKYKTLKTQVVGAQVLVVSLWVAVFSLLFIRVIEIIRIVTAGTLILVTILGWALLRGIRKETEQKEHLEKLTGELAGANAKLEELSEQKSQFLSIASHQFRSPLTAIKGYTSMLSEGSFGELNEKQEEAVNRVFKSATNLEFVVEDFLNLSRIEQGRMKYDLEKVDMRKIVKDTVQQFSPVAKERGIELKLDIDQSEAYMVKADQGKIQQVALNLIDNSLKYTPKGSITVSLSRKGNQVRIEVKDTGVGIAEENLDVLFKEFKRAKNANKVNVKGTGLGLYIAKKIVEAHGGKVWAESEGEGKGATFIVELKALEN